MNKTNNNTEWKSVIVDSDYVQEYSAKCFIVRTTMSGKGIFVPAKLCRFFIGGQCKISYLPHFDFAEKLEAFVAERAKANYENAIHKKVRSAIYDYVEALAAKNEEVDEDAEFDRLYDEWYDGRLFLNDRRAFDEEFLSKISA